MSVVELEIRGDVAIVTLARPDKLNAINDDMLLGLLDAVESVGRTDAIGAAVLTGRGRAFSAGGDITAMDGMDDDAFAATIARYMEVSAAVRACPKPFVAAVHGYALAGGFELALICDVRFAARGTQFGLPDTPLGLSPTSGMTWLLPRIVGLGRAMYLTLSADSIDADEAQRIGLVDRVVEPDDLLGRGGGLRAAAGVVSPGRGRVDEARFPRRPRERLRGGDPERGRGRARVLPVARDARAVPGLRRAQTRPGPMNDAPPRYRPGAGRRLASGGGSGGDPSAHDRRADVLVEAEQVARVVAALDLREALVGAARIRCPDTLLALGSRGSSSRRPCRSHRAPRGAPRSRPGGPAPWRDRRTWWRPGP